MTGDAKVYHYYNKMSPEQRTGIVRDIMAELIDVGVAATVVRQVTAKIAIAYIMLAHGQAQPRDFSAWFTRWWVELSQWAYANGYERVIHTPQDEETDE